VSTFAQSIALRMTIALGVIALLVFAAAGVLLHRALANELRRADHEELLGKIKIVEHFVDEARKSGDVAELRHHLDDLLLGHKDLRVWLDSSDAVPLYGGPPPVVVALLDSPGHAHVLRADDGVPMEAMEAAVADASPLPISRIRVAIETRPRERLLASYQGALLGISTLGVALSVGLSALAAWRGMRPVKLLSAEASSITPHSLATRLSDAHVDAELTGLVRAFNGVLDRLEAAYRHMEAFNADVAHELRTPLAVLMSGTHLMLASEHSKVELRETLASQMEEIEQMSSLVNDMLFLARADQGDRAGGLEPVDLGVAADRTIAYCDPLLAEAGLQAVRQGSATVACNEPLIRRALGNLLANAIKHTQSGQSVALCIEQRGDRVSLYARNPGAALPPETAARMFDRFFRAEDAGARGGASYGLGLSIVRAIALMHAGGVFSRREGAMNCIGLWLPSSSSPSDDMPGSNTMQRLARSSRIGASRPARRHRRASRKLHLPRIHQRPQRL
jgi:two-component system heavy metal sensor histidine kinase CusS